MARRWHPDKAKGDKKRASRKMNEITEAKEHLKEAFKCKRVR
jgi:DnaJ-class molecular chaperone